MKADPYPLRDVLVRERQYVVPTFQRDYEWTRDEQWELLADDLEAVADRLGQERRPSRRSDRRERRDCR